MPGQMMLCRILKTIRREGPNEYRLSVGPSSERSLRSCQLHLTTSLDDPSVVIPGPPTRADLALKCCFLVGSIRGSRADSRSILWIISGMEGSKNTL